MAIIFVRTEDGKKVLSALQAASQENVKLNDNKEIDYALSVSFPICKDGYKDEIKEELEKRGWQCGMGGFVYKEKISPDELLNCLIYMQAYRKTYEFLTEPEHLADLPLITIAEFLNLIDHKAKREKEFGKHFPKKMAWEELVTFLNKEGFTQFASS